MYSASLRLPISHLIFYYNGTRVTTREHYKSSCSIVLCVYLVQMRIRLQTVGELPKARKSGNEVVATQYRDKSVREDMESLYTEKPPLCLVGCLGGYPARTRVE